MKFKLITQIDGVELHGESGPMQTPAGVCLKIPNRSLAQAIAEELVSAEVPVRPMQHSLSRIACLALDRVTVDVHRQVTELANYGHTDLLLYRAEGPRELVTREAQAWEPILDWARSELAVDLVASEGVTPQSQSANTMQELTRAVAEFDPFPLAALYELVTLTGSLILGLAVCRGRIDADDAWRISNVDENWQAEQWGHDDEVSEWFLQRQGALRSAAGFLTYFGYPRTANGHDRRTSG